MRPTYAEIDLEAIRRNVRRIRAEVSPSTAIAAIVKANAYGHGAQKVSQAALSAGADYLGVAIPEEGVELREGGFQVPIFVLGLTFPDQAQLFIDYDLIATVSTSEFIQALAGAAQKRNRQAKVMLKVDTGMGRIGVFPEGALSFVQEVKGLPSIKLLGVFTHMAGVDSSDKAHAQSQLKRFAEALGWISASGTQLELVSAANSATMLELKNGHYNLVRPGIILYGLPPSGVMQETFAFNPAMQLKTRIVYLKQVPAGAGIGYGGTYRTAHETYIATLPVGYADGYSHHLSNRASVLIGGRRRPVVGQVCMDQIMVDLGPVCDAQMGEEAVLFGRQGGSEITVTELAFLAGTINYEFVCAVSPRVPRKYIHE